MPNWAYKTSNCASHAESIKKSRPMGKAAGILIETRMLGEATLD